MSKKYACYIAMRADLKMGRGKAIAQAIHPAVEIEDDEGCWINSTYPVIVVRAESEEHLRQLIAEAVIEEIPCKPIVDAGKTTFHGVPTLTCAAIGAVEKGFLPLLAKAKLY